MYIFEENTLFYDVEEFGKFGKNVSRLEILNVSYFSVYNMESLALKNARNLNISFMNCNFFLIFPSFVGVGMSYLCP